MKIVSVYGLSSFTTKKVAEHMNISEALIYKYFSSKENLLYCCYEVVHKKVAALLGHLISSVHPDNLPVTELVHHLWLSYFHLLIEEDYRTVFYFTYRDSKYLSTIVSHDKEAAATYFKDFTHFIHMMDARFEVFDQANANFIWTYILDTTGIFAKRTILGELPRSEESTEIIWNIMYGGISGMLHT